MLLFWSQSAQPARSDFPFPLSKRDSSSNLLSFSLDLFVTLHCTIIPFFPLRTWTNYSKSNSPSSSVPSWTNYSKSNFLFCFHFSGRNILRLTLNSYKIFARQILVFALPQFLDAYKRFQDSSFFCHIRELTSFLQKYSKAILFFVLAAKSFRFFIIVLGHLYFLS